jgi:hypothetical protein
MKMKSPMLVIFISLAMMLSCSDDIACGETQWLDAEIETLEQYEDSRHFYVTQANYSGMVVYVFRDCCPNCFTLTRVFNCYGNFLGYLNETIDPDMLKHEKIYWQPDDFACSPKL